MFQFTLAGHESEGEDNDPDLFQCGKCKQMFTSLQKYLKHKAAKNCHQQRQLREASPLTNGEVGALCPCCTKIILYLSNRDQWQVIPKYNLSLRANEVIHA